MHRVAREISLELIDYAWHDDLLDLSRLKCISLGKFGHIVT
jgi:hypothetical protein